MPSSVVVFLIFIVSVGVGTGIIIKWRHARADEILNRWAQVNRYQVLSSERCWFKGPFFALNTQEVYYVKVRTRNGQERYGWVRCGGWIAGLLSEKTKVQWDPRNLCTGSTVEEQVADIARNLYYEYESEISQADPNAAEDPLTVQKQEEATGGWIATGNVWQMLLIEEGGGVVLADLTVNGKRVFHDEGARVQNGVWHLH